MRTIRTVEELRAHLRSERSADRTIGLVPTMGAFHAGHVSLMQRARASKPTRSSSRCSSTRRSSRPARTSPPTRATRRRDAEIAAAAGVDVLFAPAVEARSTRTASRRRSSVGALADPLEGAQRPGHFDGVATVVTKLLNIVRPDDAFFGQKDAQQALIVRRVVRDLDIPVEIAVCPTVREPDGLAMSSRNAYLAPADRERAVALRRALDAAEAAVAAGERATRAPSPPPRAARWSPTASSPSTSRSSPQTALRPSISVDGEILVALAARVGPARLIDNTFINANGRA